MNFRIILIIMIISSLAVSCRDDVFFENNLEHEKLFGVWERSDPTSQNYIENSWIPTNLHIGGTNELSKIRVRILDPIACTDSYPGCNNSTVSFEQYGLNITLNFLSSESGTMLVSKNGRVISYSIIKTNKTPFWGMCD